MRPDLPAPEDIARPCPDGLYAIENFHGKTLEEAEAMLADGCALTYTEDLMWMEPVGFRFYVQAFIRFCLSERATGDSDAINGMESALRIWLESRPQELTSCANMLADFCRIVVEQFARFDADTDIYGPLCGKYEELEEAFARLVER